MSDTANLPTDNDGNNAETTEVATVLPRRTPWDFFLVRLLVTVLGAFVAIGAVVATTYVVENHKYSAKPISSSSATRGAVSQTPLSCQVLKKVVAGLIAGDVTIKSEDGGCKAYSSNTDTTIHLQVDPASNGFDPQAAYQVFEVDSNDSMTQCGQAVQPFTLSTLKVGSNCLIRPTGAFTGQMAAAVTADDSIYVSASVTTTFSDWLASQKGVREIIADAANYAVG